MLSLTQTCAKLGDSFGLFPGNRFSISDAPPNPMPSHHRPGMAI